MTKEMPEGRKFKKGQSGNPAGRKPKLHTILKRQGLTSSEINSIILEMLAMSTEDLEKLCKSKKVRSFELLVASAISKGIKKGDLSQIFGYALTRALGQPKNTEPEEKEIVFEEVKTYEKK